MKSLIAGLAFTIGNYGIVFSEDPDTFSVQQEIIKGYRAVCSDPESTELISSVLVAGRTERQDDKYFDHVPPFSLLYDTQGEPMPPILVKYVSKFQTVEEINAHTSELLPTFEKQDIIDLTIRILDVSDQAIPNGGLNDDVSCVLLAVDQLGTILFIIEGSIAYKPDIETPLIPDYLLVM